jgi:hypothetical protein
LTSTVFGYVENIAIMESGLDSRSSTEIDLHFGKNEKWTTAMNFDLIAKMKDRPILWDFRRSDYSNTEVRRAAMEEIARELNKSYDSCYKAWRTMRSSCCRELKLHQRINANKKKWQFFEAMSFLHDLMRLRSHRHPEGSESDSHSNAGEAVELVDEECDGDGSNATEMFSQYDGDKSFSDGHVQSPTVQCNNWNINDDMLPVVKKKQRHDDEQLSTTSNERQKIKVSNASMISNNGDQVGSQGGYRKRWNVQDDLLLEVRKKLRNDDEVLLTVAPNDRESIAVPNSSEMSNNAALVQDSCQKFGQYIASCLAGMNPRHRAQAQLKIQQVLFYMTLENEAE